MLTFNVYDRVLFIRAEHPGNVVEYGTAFTLDVEGRQYLISARHVVGDGSSPFRLKVLLQGDWIDLPVRLVGAGSGEIDITVLSPEPRLSQEMPLAPSLGLVLGQDVFFCGFPFKMHSNGGKVMYGRPLPFVKKGTLSAGWDLDDPVKKAFVDAINNEGFSGGPLLFYPLTGGPHCVAGVVSKFMTQRQKVDDADGEDSGMTVEYNTGFLIAYGINPAIDIIKRRPIGVPIHGPAAHFPEHRGPSDNF